MKIKEFFMKMNKIKSIEFLSSTLFLLYKKDHKSCTKTNKVLTLRRNKQLNPMS